MGDEDIRGFVQVDNSNTCITQSLIEVRSIV